MQSKNSGGHRLSTFDGQRGQQGGLTRSREDEKTATAAGVQDGRVRGRVCERGPASWPRDQYKWPPGSPQRGRGWEPGEFVRSTQGLGIECGAGGLPLMSGFGANSNIFWIIQGLTRAQANGAGWPCFNGKYVSYLKVQKGVVDTYREIYHGHVREDLTCLPSTERERPREQGAKYAGEHRGPHRTVADIGCTLWQTWEVCA